MFSRSPKIFELPDDMLMEIETRLRNYNAEAYKKRVNDFVSQYGDVTLDGADHLRMKMIDEINIVEWVEKNVLSALSALSELSALTSVVNKCKNQM